MSRTWKVVPTALGWVPLVFGEAGLQEVGLPAPEAEARAWARARAQEEATHPLAERVASLLRLYAQGVPVSFASLPIDWPGVPSFSQRVLEEVRAIPWGETRTYSWLAAKVGRPQAARAVGRALAANPLPIVVPCHRVVRGDGRLGGYRGGLGWKERLLRLEGALEAGLHLPPGPQEGLEAGDQLRAHMGLG